MKNFSHIELKEFYNEYFYNSGYIIDILACICFYHISIHLSTPIHFIIIFSAFQNKVQTSVYSLQVLPHINH